MTKAHLVEYPLMPYAVDGVVSDLKKFSKALRSGATDEDLKELFPSEALKGLQGWVEAIDQSGPYGSVDG